MNILMLGGTGYLGSNIVHALSDNGHNVTCIVRQNSKRGIIDGLDGVKFIMNDTHSIESELMANQYDWVINSVCIYRQNDSLYWDMFEANLIFPLKVLNLAAKYHVKNYMNMGTSLPDGFNMYSFSKARLSELGRYMSEHEGLINFAELRLEMFYGNYAGGGGGYTIRGGSLKTA